VQTLLLKRPGLTMILQEKTSRYKGPLPVLVVYDGSELARKALHEAVNLVGEKDAPLKIILLAEDTDHADRMKEEIGRQLRTRGMKAETRTLINPTLGRLARAVQMESGGPVVIPCDSHMLQGEALCALMSEIPNPVLVVRQ